VLVILLELDLFREVIDDAVHPGADIAPLAGVLEELDILPLPPPNHGGEDLEAGALGVLHELVHNLVHCLLADLLAALGAVRHADAGPEEAEIVIDLRHRAHGGAGVFGGGLLVDGDGGAEAVDGVHIRLLHLAQELPGIGAEALHIAALALGIDGVEGKAGFPAAGEAGEDHQLVPGDVQIHVFQVVCPRPADRNIVAHAASSLCRVFQKCYRVIIYPAGG